MAIKEFRGCGSETEDFVGCSAEKKTGETNINITSHSGQYFKIPVKVLSQYVFNKLFNFRCKQNWLFKTKFIIINVRWIKRIARFLQNNHYSITEQYWDNKQIQHDKDYTMQKTTRKRKYIKQHQISGDRETLVYSRRLTKKIDFKECVQF